MPKKTEKLGKGGRPIKRDANGRLAKGTGAHVDAGRPQNHASHAARQAYWEGRDIEEIERIAINKTKHERRGISSMDIQIIIRIHESAQHGGLPSYKELRDRSQGKSRQMFMIESPLVDETQLDKREVARQVAFLLSLGLSTLGDIGASKQPTIAQSRSSREGDLLLSADDPVHGHPEAGS